MRRREVEDRRVLDARRRRNDRVAETNIHLEADDRPGDTGFELHAHAEVALSFPNVLCANGLLSELDGVRGDRSAAHLLEEGLHLLRGGLAAAEQVEVTGGPEGLGRPHGDEHGPLQDEPIRVSRNRETVEEPLQGEARQDEVEILAALARDVEQALADRRAKVCGRLLQDSASRYGRITRATRQISAYRRSSSTLPRRRRYSRRSSSATSRPILFRNLKQSATVFA